MRSSLFVFVEEKGVRERILIVEDDRAVGGLVSRLLRSCGYRTDYADNGADAIRKLKEQTYHLAILDLVLPVKSGDQVLRELRSFSSLPVIAISGKDITAVKIDILNLGADDYITKPFDLDEALARIEAILRRGAGARATSELACGSLRLNVEERSVRVRGKMLLLTPKEFGILETLMRNPNRIFSKESLFVSVWGEQSYGVDATLNVHMSNLRNKLKKIDPIGEYIETLWGMGYRIADEVQNGPAIA